MATLAENYAILRMAEKAGEVLGGELCILDENGDSRMQWDRNDPDQVKAAEARFDELRNRGYLAYKVDPSGNQGEVLHKFDPSAERIILHQRMVGG